MQTHRETPHFIRFNGKCEEYLQEPRTRCVFESIFPEEKIWVANVEKNELSVLQETQDKGIIMTT